MRSHVVPGVHQLFCRLKCFNNVNKYNKFNECICHPDCKQLNYDPNLACVQSYRLLYNKRDCGCPDNNCKRIYPNNFIHSK